MGEYNYPPNSNRSKEEQKDTSIKNKKVEKVAKGKTKKRSELSKLSDIFVAEDAQNIKSYILMDVIVPVIQRTICDIFEDIPRMIFYGGTGKGAKRNESRVSYRDYYDRDRSRRYDEPRIKRRFDYDDIIFDTRGDAEAVLDQMDDMVREYGVVNVADMYDMADISNPPYTSNKYGWTSVRNAEVVRVREGYIIKLPKAMPID